MRISTHASSSLLAALLFIGGVQPAAGVEQGSRGHDEATCTSRDLMLPAGERYPNGIARASDGTIYVGLVTSGHILRKRPGEDWALWFAGTDTVFASTSLRLDERHGLLWGNSPDFLPNGKARQHRIFALDLSTGAVRHSLPLPGGRMGNDIVVAPDGTVYLTETATGAIMRLLPGRSELETLLQDERLAGPAGIGAAGIVRTDDGTLIVNNFGTGKLYAVTAIEQGRPLLREILLPRRIENPDGMALAPDGALIVLENAIQSGAGKILRISGPLSPGRRDLEIMREGLESPVNLDVSADGCALVSEARIRHRLLPGREAEVPDRFRILEVPLGQAPVHP